ncbi:MAG TPA: ABC transporter ATP-binding protein/permease [Candidatus Eisenbergiella stercorigallinarum]|uniref:ABC transporter ATP-binding protein/permease n=1 Tax=Candidatus Eisenbergiella stercorigallinarum TaxID=2838557 RepID=A0A9D2U0V8_9FIRM|nr:ABC transporter ATP-binding protein/permease [Candidatus Eisenbergiella stercorigallinarum]
MLYGLILLRQSPLVPLLVLVPALLVFLLKRKAMRKDHELRPAADEAARKMRYVEERGWDLKAGKDIRMYGLGGWLLSILKRERETGETNVRRWENGYLAANLCDALLCFVRDAGAYLYFILQIVQGSLPVSDFVWYISVVSSCQQACSAFLENVELLGRLSFDYSRLRLFLESGEGDIFQGTGAEECEKIPPEESGKTGAGAERGGRKAVPDSAAFSRTKEAVGIELEHVSFTYPGSRVPTLKDLNLTIRPGEKIALVGLNGAGKSTLVKLLCGLYRPTSGTIRVGGRPISSFGKEEYFSMIAAVFQDVKLLPLTIAQNVASDNGEDIDRQRVRQCLSLAGLWEMVDGLPQKEDTPLGRGVLDDGIDLSGGERQKVWMARAFYKEAPILILDEPTAALDPLAEQEIYEKYVQMSEGRTSLFISHRLASTRFCDRIVLLENGRITEQGSHEELMEKNGAYAGLFEVQGKYYRKEESGKTEAGGNTAEWNQAMKMGGVQA